MLLRTIALVAFVVALATALLHACAALARARVHRAAAIAAAAGFDRGLAAAQVAIATAIAGGDDPRSVAFVAPTPAPACASVAADGSCALTVAVAIASTTAQAVGSGSAPCASACAWDLQGNDAVEEGRLALRVTASAVGPNGTIFSTRDRYALFRTTRVPPFASLIGERDATGEGVALGASEGEDAGTPALTTVDVRYVNGTTGASVEGNAWRSGAWEHDDAGATAWEP
ncbi:MAG TPA: hypothetical protein VIG46_01005 [Candidatus Baltobacteraceae bacterium]